MPKTTKAHKVRPININLDDIDSNPDSLASGSPPKNPNVI